MDRLRAFEVFATVVAKGSFVKAADALDTSPANVTRYVNELETHLSVRLLNRSSRKLSLTESGTALFERCRAILNDVAEAEAIASHGTLNPAGRLRINAGVTFGIKHLSPLWPVFMKKYPEIELDFHITDNKVDLIDDGYDLMITIGQLADSSLRASRLFSHRLPVVGAPALFDRYGRPSHPADLLKMPLMIYTHVREAQEWRFFHPVHGEHLVMVDGAIRVNNGLAGVPILLAGLAATLQPEVYIWDELRDGRLEEVLTDWSLVPVPVHILTPPGRARPARVRVLIEFLREHFAKQPWAHGIET